MSSYERGIYGGRPTKDNSNDPSSIHTIHTIHTTKGWLLARSHRRVATYAWALTMVGLVNLIIAFTGGMRSEVFVLLIVTSIFLVGPSYPIAMEIVLGAVTAISYVITLAASGWGISMADLVFRLGMIITGALTIGFLNHERSRSMQRQSAEVQASKNRVALWSRVAAVARQIDVSEIEYVLQAVVDALEVLGFESSDICAIDAAGDSYHVLHSRNLNADYTSGHHAAGGVVGMVLQKRSTVVVYDYGARADAVPILARDGYLTVVACPVWVDGKVGAILEAATREHWMLSPEEIAAFEMLGIQAGLALNNAHLLQRQKQHADTFRHLPHSGPDAVVVVNVSDGMIVEVSTETEGLFGYTAGELVGKSTSMLVPERVRDQQNSIIKNKLQEIGMVESVIGVEHPVFVVRKDGVEFPIEASLHTLATPEGEVISVAIRDVTERHDFERRLAHQTTHDQLTGLANRELFKQRLTRSLHARLTVDPPITVCFLDLDHFKYLNDGRGYRVGDSLVIAVAERLHRLMNGNFIARVGGDEFGLIVEGLADRADAVTYGKRLLSAFNQPFDVANISCYVTASIGIAFGSASDQAEAIMSNADAAVNRAKRNGRSRFEFFDEALTQQASDRVDIQVQLHMALERKEFRLKYQPVVALDDGRILGMEALLRWSHPTRGEVQPAEFISIAEDAGLIVPIGRWVLQEACRQLADWHHRFPDRPIIAMAVNVSNRQLEHDRFVNDTAEVLRSTQIPPESLVLEITESFFMRDIEAAIRRLQALKDLGIRLAIDDFGTGFSSLFSLSRLPVDVVKIDKVFIDGLGTRYDAVVSAVVALGDAFGLSVTAEGIESGVQRDRLVELGCQFGQGYYFSKPLDPAAAESILTSDIQVAEHTPRSPRR